MQLTKEEQRVIISYVAQYNIEQLFEYINYLIATRNSIVYEEGYHDGYEDSKWSCRSVLTSRVI